MHTNLRIPWGLQCFAGYRCCAAVSQRSNAKIPGALGLASGQQDKDNQRWVFPGLGLVIWISGGHQGLNLSNKVRLDQLFLHILIHPYACLENVFSVTGSCEFLHTP